MGDRRISFSSKVGWFAILFAMVILPMHSSFANDIEGIALEKDVTLYSPIQSPEELPDQISFSLYESQDATVPLATQVFPRGKYSMDFDFSKSDGVSAGSVARLKVYFTEKLNLQTDTDSPKKPNELWSELSVAGEVVGERARIPDEAMVKLLLASDASIATYLTVAYEGDANPITTIYRDVPLASGTTATDYITSVIGSAIASSGDLSTRSLSSPYWDQSGSNIYYTDGNVGIGIPTPEVKFNLLELTSRKDAARFSVNSSDTLPGYAYGIQINNVNGTNGNYTVIGNIDSTQQWNSWLEFINVQHGTGGATPKGGFAFSTRNGNNYGRRMYIDENGNIGIGTGTSTPPYMLSVNGTIGCTALIVKSNLWADFVFQDNYKIPSLTEVEEYISQNKHLPGIPTEAEIKERGVSVGTMSSKLLQKIEELTLYLIDLKKENDSLKSQIANIENQLSNRTH